VLYFLNPRSVSLLPRVCHLPYFSRISTNNSTAPVIVVSVGEVFPGGSVHEGVVQSWRIELISSLSVIHYVILSSLIPDYPSSL